MDGQGEFVTYGAAKKRIPQTKPPCWSCPKHAEQSQDNRPFDAGADFGPWFHDLLDWFAEGRACGFDADDFMRQGAGIIDGAERRAERASTQRLMLTVLQRR